LVAFFIGGKVIKSFIQLIRESIGILLLMISMGVAFIGYGFFELATIVSGHPNIIENEKEEQ
jgi:hypothetical protein